MKTTTRSALFLVALALTATGCGSGFTVPETFCDAVVKKDDLSPLLPEGEKLKNKRMKARSKPGAFCSLSVDGTRILYVAYQHDDAPLLPENRRAVIQRLERAATRKVSFPGEAIIGSNGAEVSAKCIDPTPYLTFDVQFAGERVEDSSSGYKKLQRFLDDFVPAVTEHLECTADS
ncbi:hypothetical protein ACIHCV_23430 [Streptomyces sp. NPDC051956]|uniref:hypothetical protein n=1 Tax=Streptomyces sp. NPDC051956 TaxID=3365677 RepID=UPI0037CE8B4A